MENVWVDYSQLLGLAVGIGLIVQSLALLLGFCGLHFFPRSFQRHFGWFGFLFLSGLLLLMLSPMLQPLCGSRVLQVFFLTVFFCIGLAALVFRQPEKFLLSGKKALTGSQQYQTVELDLADDMDANIVMLKPRRAKAPNLNKYPVTLVLVHGGGNDRLYGLWYLVESLLNRGHDVLAGHMPGHGRGGRDLFSAKASRQRIHAMVRIAKQVNPTRPVVLLGQSMGAALVLDAVSRGLSVDAVVTVSMLYRLDLNANVFSELWAFTRPAIFRSLWYGNPCEVLPAAGRFKRRVFPVRVAKGVSYVQEFRSCLDQLDLLENLRLRQINCPVRLIHGARDGVVSVNQAHELGRAIGPMAQIEIYDRCTHLDPLFDSKVVDELLAWLEAPDLRMSLTKRSIA